MHFDMLNRWCDRRGSRSWLWQTDRRTDGQTNGRTDRLKSYRLMLTGPFPSNREGMTDFHTQNAPMQINDASVMQFRANGYETETVYWYMAFLEQLCSVVILEPKRSNTIYVHLLQPSTISVMYTTLVRTDWSSQWIVKRIYIAQVLLDNTLVLSNFH